MDAATVTTITSAVDFTEVIVGIGSVFAALVLVKVAMVGGRKLIGAIR